MSYVEATHLPLPEIDFRQDDAPGRLETVLDYMRNGELAACVLRSAGVNYDEMIERVGIPFSHNYLRTHLPRIEEDLSADGMPPSTSTPQFSPLRAGYMAARPLELMGIHFVEEGRARARLFIAKPELVAGQVNMPERIDAIAAGASVNSRLVEPGFYEADLNAGDSLLYCQSGQTPLVSHIESLMRPRISNLAIALHDGPSEQLPN